MIPSKWYLVTVLTRHQSDSSREQWAAQENRSTALPRKQFLSLTIPFLSSFRGPCISVTPSVSRSLFFHILLSILANRFPIVVLFPFYRYVFLSAFLSPLLLFRPAVSTFLPAILDVLFVTAPPPAHTLREPLCRLPHHQPQSRTNVANRA